MGGQGCPSPPGGWGWALEERLFVGGGLGGGCARRGRMRPRPGSQESPPRRPGENRTPSAACPPGPRLSRARAHVCAPCGARELSPHARGAPLETPLPTGAGRRVTPSDRRLWGRPTRPNRAGGVARGVRTAPRLSAPRAPGPGLGTAAPRSRGSWGIPVSPQTGRAAMDPSADAPGLPACFSPRIYNKRPEKESVWLGKGGRRGGDADAVRTRRGARPRAPGARVPRSPPRPLARTLPRLPSSAHAPRVLGWGPRRARSQVSWEVPFQRRL